MAAILATALPIGPRIGVHPDVSPVVRPRPCRMVCRWVVDPETGRLVASWEPDAQRRKPILHLRVVRA